MQMNRRLILVLAVALLAASAGCVDSRLDGLEQRVSALESKSGQPEAPSPTPTATSTTTLVPMPSQTAAAPTMLQQPPIAERDDICYRSIPVQEALLDALPGPDLCAAINIGELYRLEQLSIDIEDKRHSIRRADFAGLVNLRYIEYEGPANLAPDVFQDLIALETARIEIRLEPNTTLSGRALFGLPPALKAFTLNIYQGDDERQIFVLPDDLFASVPNLEMLSIRMGNPHDNCAEFSSKTFSGLSRLSELDIGEFGRGILPLPRDVFADLVALQSLRISERPCRWNSGELEQDQNSRHKVYLPTVTALLRVSEDCNCEVVGLIE